jgi:hypothetical protein
VAVDLVAVEKDLDVREVVFGVAEFAEIFACFKEDLKDGESRLRLR